MVSSVFQHSTMIAPYLGEVDKPRGSHLVGLGCAAGGDDRDGGCFFRRRDGARDGAAKGCHYAAIVAALEQAGEGEDGVRYR